MTACRRVPFRSLCSMRSAHGSKLHVTQPLVATVNRCRICRAAYGCFLNPARLAVFQSTASWSIGTSLDHCIFSLDIPVFERVTESDHTLEGLGSSTASTRSQTQCPKNGNISALSTSTPGCQTDFWKITILKISKKHGALRYLLIKFCVFLPDSRTTWWEQTKCGVM